MHHSPSSSNLVPMPPERPLGDFKYWFQDGKHNWAQSEDAFFNRISMDAKLVTGDVGDWRAGHSVAWGTHELLIGRADREITQHLNAEVLAHMKAVAGTLVEI